MRPGTFSDLVEESRRHHRAKELALAAVAAVSLLLVASLALRFMAPEQDAAAIVSPASLTITAPATVSAGESLEMTVQAPVPDRTDVALGVFGALESTLLEATASKGEAHFLLESELLDHAGRLTLVAEIGTTRTTHNLLVLAGTPVEPVVPLVGPRTIVANGQDLTMVVVSPVDEFGNPLPDGTAVDIAALRPDGVVERFSLTVEQGLAATVVTSTTTAGRVSITASIADKHGPVNVVDQVAGRPADFTIATVGTNDVAGQFFADGFTLFEVSTSELRDIYGNLVPDGVVAIFEITSPDGLAFASTSVQGGFATATLASPTLPGSVVIHARTSGHDSAKLTLEFKAAIESLPAPVVHDVDGFPRVHVGPVVTVRGGYPADGTPVTVRDAQTGDVVATASMYRGNASVTLRDRPNKPLVVDVLGASAQLSAQDDG